MSDTTTRYATRDFTDAGTERFFARGLPLTDVTPGALANYEAAGLAGDKPDAEQPVEGAASTVAGAEGDQPPAGTRRGRGDRAD